MEDRIKYIWNFGQGYGEDVAETTIDVDITKACENRENHIANSRKKYMGDV